MGPELKFTDCEWDDLKPGDWYSWGDRSHSYRIARIDSRSVERDAIYHKEDDRFWAISDYLRHSNDIRHHGLVKVTGIPGQTLVTTGVNPKDLIGVKKPSLRFVPMSSVYLMGQAMEDGGKKYGPFNWRLQPVNASVYYDAAMRHLNQWFHGETHARDSKVHHLAHAMACLAILLDAETQDSLNDDRPKVGKPMDDFIEAHTKS